MVFTNYFALLVNKSLFSHEPPKYPITYCLTIISWQTTLITLKTQLSNIFYQQTYFYFIFYNQIFIFKQLIKFVFLSCILEFNKVVCVLIKVFLTYSIYSWIIEISGDGILIVGHVLVICVINYWWNLEVVLIYQ